jgi:hypothetical protein
VRPPRRVSLGRCRAVAARCVWAWFWLGGFPICISFSGAGVPRRNSPDDPVDREADHLRRPRPTQPRREHLRKPGPPDGKFPSRFPIYLSTHFVVNVLLNVLTSGSNSWDDVDCGL